MPGAFGAAGRSAAAIALLGGSIRLSDRVVAASIGVSAAVALLAGAYALPLSLTPIAPSAELVARKPPRPSIATRS